MEYISIGTGRAFVNGVDIGEIEDATFQISDPNARLTTVDPSGTDYEPVFTFGGQLSVRTARFEIEGAEQTRQLINDLTGAFEPVAEAFAAFARSVREAARLAYPVHTGRLRESISEGVGFIDPVSA